MFKKTLTVIGVSAALILGGSAAASADTYPVPPGGVEATDTTIAPGETVTLTVNEIQGETSATFTASGGSSTLASVVFASAGGSSVTKSVVGGSTSAAFTPLSEGDHTIVVVGGSGATLASIVISVDESFRGGAAGGTGSGGTGGSGGLAITGSDVPVTALWFGAGALGLGGIAVAAGVARKRAAAVSSN